MEDWSIIDLLEAYTPYRDGNFRWFFTTDLWTIECLVNIALRRTVCKLLYKKKEIVNHCYFKSDKYSFIAFEQFTLGFDLGFMSVE